MPLERISQRLHRFRQSRACIRIAPTASARSVQARARPILSQSHSQTMVRGPTVSTYSTRSSTRSLIHSIQLSWCQGRESGPRESSAYFFGFSSGSPISALANSGRSFFLWNFLISSRSCTTRSVFGALSQQSHRRQTASCMLAHNGGQSGRPFTTTRFFSKYSSRPYPLSRERPASAVLLS